jgi:hypothetical protein
MIPWPTPTGTRSARTPTRCRALGKAYTQLASRHRLAASALERGQKQVTYDRHFNAWILALSELSAEAERLLALEIELARGFGVTWEEVGAALGVSRQAAWDRLASHERWQKSRRVSRLRVAYTSARKAELLREVRNRVDGSETELLALKDWLEERPPRADL